MSREQYEGLILAIISLRRFRVIGSKVFTGGFKTEFITENKTFGLESFAIIMSEQYVAFADFTAFW